MPPLSPQELACIKVTRAWAATHPEELWIDCLLTLHNINMFLMSCARLHVPRLKFMFIDTVSIFPLEPTERSRCGVVIAPKAREQRSKKRNEGGKGKGRDLTQKVLLHLHIPKREPSRSWRKAMFSHRSHHQGTCSLSLSRYHLRP